MSEPTTPTPLDALDGGRGILLVTGAPGAGKSTITDLVTRALTRSARLDGFFVSQLVVSGHVWALGEPADEAARQVRLCHANLCALAGNVADAGFTPVIDTVVPDREQLGHFRDGLAGRPLLLVVLDPGADACIERNANRPPREQFFFDGYDRLRRTMRDGFGELGWWLDTSGLTAEETAAQILQQAPTRALVAP